MRSSSSTYLSGIDPGGGLTHARAQHHTPYGLAESSWKIEAGQIEVVVVVPPNATASVTLPGGDAKSIEVGAGTHRWSYPYQEPSTGRPPRSLDSTLTELIDDPVAWNAVMTTMRRYMPMQAGAEAILQGFGDMTLRQVLAILAQTDEVAGAIEAALASLGR